MQTRDIIELGLSFLGGLAVLFFGGGYLISQWKAGSKQEKADIISNSSQIVEFYKSERDGYKEIIQTLTEKVRVLTGELGEIRGQLRTEKEQNDRLEKIFQNRNPEMEQFMKTSLEVSKQAQDFMMNNKSFQETQHQVMEEIRNFMKQINENLSLVNKDLKIEATVTKQ
jgi:pantoate kinase